MKGYSSFGECSIYGKYRESPESNISCVIALNVRYKQLTDDTSDKEEEEKGETLFVDLLIKSALNELNSYPNFDPTSSLKLLLLLKYIKFLTSSHDNFNSNVKQC